MAKKNNLLPIIACLVVMFSIGIVYLWSVFQKPAVAYYGWEPNMGRTISSVMIFMFIFGNMIGGFVQDKTSPRFSIFLGGALFFIGLFLTSIVGGISPWVALITYGVIAGMGVGFAYSGSLNCIQKWFPHRRGLAAGMSVCAFGLSAVAFAPIAEWLLQLPAFGENAVPLTFRTIGIIFTILILLSGFFVKNPSDEYLSKLKIPAKFVEKKQYTPKEVVKTPTYYFLILTIFFLPAVFMIINPIVKTLGEFRAVTPAQLTITMSLSGVVQAVSRLLCGVISDKIGRARTVFIIAILSIIACILITFVTGWMYMVVVWLIFFVYAGPSSIYPGMSTDIYGTKNSGGNYGIALIFLGISSLAFTQISNIINADGAATGNYTTSFIVAGCACIIPLVVLPLYDIYKKRLKAAEVAEK